MSQQYRYCRYTRTLTHNWKAPGWRRTLAKGHSIVVNSLLVYPGEGFSTFANTVDILLSSLLTTMECVTNLIARQIRRTTTRLTSLIESSSQSKNFHHELIVCEKFLFSFLLQVKQPCIKRCHLPSANDFANPLAMMQNEIL